MSSPARRKGPQEQARIYDIGLAVAGGDYLALQAHQIIDKFPKDRAALAEWAVRSPGAVLASASNLALSIELFLKALILSHRQPIQHTHKLPTLFGVLPLATRTRLCERYEMLEPPFGPKHRTLELYPADQQSQTSTYPISDYSLSAVLTRNADLYVVWRYAFEHLHSEPRTPLVFEFSDLSRAAAAVRSEFGAVEIAVASNAP